MGKRKPKKPERIEFETFRKLGSYEIANMRQEEPSCFNNILRIRKFRVIIEPIEEPEEVLRGRLQSLWDKNDNYHNWAMLKSAAMELGFDLEEHRGKGHGEDD